MGNCGLAFVFAALLAGCTLGSGAKPLAPAQNPITGDAIATTTLEAATPVEGQPSVIAKEPAVKADPKPDTTKPAVVIPDPTPIAPLPPEALSCAKKGDKWLPSPNGLMSCTHFTRDSGKACSKDSQCEGYCFARSGTCAPVTPLYGCNEILQDNGARVTLCID